MWTQPQSKATQRVLSMTHDRQFAQQLFVGWSPQCSLLAGSVRGASGGVARACADRVVHPRIPPFTRRLPLGGLAGVGEREGERPKYRPAGRQLQARTSRGEGGAEAAPVRDFSMFTNSTILAVKPAVAFCSSVSSLSMHAEGRSRLNLSSRSTRC